MKGLQYHYYSPDFLDVGHSLGGGIASLMGVTFGAPVVAFESPGEKMAAARLHLPSPVRGSSRYYSPSSYLIEIYFSLQHNISPMSTIPLMYVVCSMF